jgi:hypothetical protein
MGLLNIIAPPSTMENTWRLVTGLGMSFFSAVLREKPIGEFISGVPQKPEFSQNR